MPGKVLIADRSVKIQKELAALVEEAGFESVTFNNGEHAVRFLAKEKPALVLADIFMPVRTGYEVCAHIKGNAETADIPVVLLVGNTEPYDEQRALVVGADAKIEKPLADPKLALAIIKKHLPQVTAAPPQVATPPPAPKPAPAQASAPVVADDEPPVTEAELFFQGPEPVHLEPGSVPMGLPGLLGEEITAAVATVASRSATEPAAGAPDIKEVFLKQKEALRKRTLEVIAHLKPEQMGWRPEKEALSVGEMLRHLWMSEEGVRKAALQGDMSYYEPRLQKGLRAVLGQPRSLEEELKSVEQTHQETLKQVAAFPLERWQDERVHAGLGIRRKVYALLYGINEHEAHHRAQLMLYLRLLGMPLPEPAAPKPR